MKIIESVAVGALTLAAITSTAGEGLQAAPVRASKEETAIAAVVPKALRYLQQVQNHDGSWGSGELAIQATALALSAFLRSGETGNSAVFGETVRKAHLWLAPASPHSDEDRIAVIMSLADSYTLGRQVADAQRVSAMLGNVPAQGTNAWRTMLSTTRLPDESVRPSWATNWATAQSPALAAPHLSPETLPQCLQTVAAARAGHTRGGDQWSGFWRAFALEASRRQTDDGALSTKGGDAAVVATAAGVLVFAERSQGSIQFRPPSLRPEPQRDDEVIIRVGE